MFKEQYLSSIKDKKKALNIALDVRKFEIDLYWKRTAYFWAFIAATFAVFVSIDPLKNEGIRLVTSCFGIVLSFAWILVNRGSKFWQENWEAHVDLLEDDEIGALYKTVLVNEGNNISKMNIILVGSSPFSVSKINQLISIFILIIWIILLCFELPFSLVVMDINHISILSIIATGMACLALLVCGKSKLDSSQINYIAKEREVDLVDRE